MIVSVLWIEPVLTTTAGLLVTMLADKILSARLATTEPCSCPSGYVGDPLTACRPSRRAASNVVGFSRFKRSLEPYFKLFPEF
jgi:hypothetical protein